MLVDEITVGDDITGKKLPVAFGTLAFLDFSDSLHGNEHLEDVIPHFLSLNTAQHAVQDPFFKA